MVEEVSGEQGSGIVLRAKLSTKLPGIEQEFVGDLIFGGVKIGLTMGEDVPDRDQDFACDGDDGLLDADAGFETLEFGFPVRVELDGGPGVKRQLDNHISDN